LVENEDNVIALIPARYGSTRLKGKLLLDVNGKPLLRRVWESASRASSIRRIIIAVDDERLAELCMEMGAEFIMTPTDLNSGSDRIAFAYNELGEDADTIINIQGDEPLITGDLLDNLAKEFKKSKCDAGTIIRKINKTDELEDPSVVKVVMDNNNNALYFSRNAIPFVRDTERSNWPLKADFWKHIGIYIYKKDTLLNFVNMDESKLEEAEKLEQMRLLQNGYRILCIPTDSELYGVDTADDYHKVDSYFKKIENTTK
jgi:3-deoxy-manno-octulosonate cytidylyltransferase (CMP-KDO synthetase)